MEQEEKITKEMTMGEIIEKWPGAAEVMQSFGLHCIGCHVNIFETLEQGVLGHGMPEEAMNSLLEELNKMASSGKIGEQTKEIKEDVIVTELAAQKLKELLKSYNANGIRIKVVKAGCEHVYSMDFENTEQIMDKVVDMNGIRFYIDEESFALMRGVTMKYIETPQGAGFKFDKSSVVE